MNDDASFRNAICRLLRAAGHIMEKMQVILLADRVRAGEYLGLGVAVGPILTGYMASNTESVRIGLAETRFYAPMSFFSGRRLVGKDR